MDKMSTNNTTPEEKALTIAQMMERYPRDVVKEAIVRKNYKEGRDKTIQEFNELISKGINVESCKEGLQELLKTTPPAPPIDPTEPSDLDADVLWRMGVLKYFIRPGCDDKDLANMEAILDAYRTRKLKVYDNQVTVWFAGHMTMGLFSSDPNKKHIFDNFFDWQAKYGPGRIWIEHTVVATAKLSSATIAPSNDDLQHIFQIRTRLLGTEEFITLGNILDDTGSVYLELYRNDDCKKLNLTPDYHAWNPNVTLDTANGTIVRKSLNLEVHLLVDEEPFGPVLEVAATITLGSGRNQLRCSGMFLRQALFTATSPNGQGELYISEKKTGVTRLLPAV